MSSSYFIFKDGNLFKENVTLPTVIENLIPYTNYADFSIGTKSDGSDAITLDSFSTKKPIALDYSSIPTGQTIDTTNLSNLFMDVINEDILNVSVSKKTTELYTYSGYTLKVSLDIRKIENILTFFKNIFSIITTKGIKNDKINYESINSDIGNIPENVSELTVNKSVYDIFIPVGKSMGFSGESYYKLITGITIYILLDLIDDSVDKGNTSDAVKNNISDIVKSVNTIISDSYGDSSNISVKVIDVDIEDINTTVAPTTVAPTTVAPTTVAPTTVAPTTVAPTTVAPTTVAPTTVAPTTVAPTTVAPTTVAPTTVEPTTVAPTTVAPTTVAPTTVAPTTVAPTTVAPTTVAPTTVA